jgi:thiazole synthase
VAVRRVNLTDPTQPLLVDYVKPTEFTFLPNTAGCFTGEDAVRTLRLAREAGGWDLVKLEVLSDPKTLYPDMEETLRSLKLLVAEGFQVMVYCSDDPVYAASWKRPARWRSCRWARRSARAWASRTA